MGSSVLRGDCGSRVRLGLAAVVFFILLAVLPASGLELTMLPDEPEVIPVFGGNPDQIVDQISTSRFDVTYTVHGGYAGGGLIFEDFTTPESEYSDLSGMTSLVFTVGGTPYGAKFEIEDIYTNKAAVLISGIQPYDQFLQIPFEILALSNPNFDRSRTRWMFYILQPGGGAGCVGSGNEEGVLRVACGGGLPYVYNVYPQTTGELTPIPGNPKVIEVGGAHQDTVLTQTGETEFEVAYNVETGGWSGATVLFDNYGTPTNESQDLSSFTHVVFGLTGTPRTVKFEIEDIHTNRLNVMLKSDAGVHDLYAVSLAEVSTRNVDVSQIRFMNFVIDKERAGYERGVGTLHFTMRGPLIDSDSDGMSDFVEESYGLDPHDDGSTNSYNGAGGDFDNDGVLNIDEIIAGTSPTSPASLPLLETAGVAGAAELEIEGALGRRYDFYYNDHLLTDSWHSAGAPVYPTSNGLLRTTFSLPSDATRSFKVKITKE